MDDDYKKWYIKITNISYQAIQTINNMVLPSNPAIIFDIDDTLIDSTDNIIYPILNIYKFAKVLNLTIIIVTNRSGDEDSIEFTLDQIQKVQYLK
jgi:ribonucleotide monophosphatase NagD (HAD superfamily)